MQHVEINVNDRVVQPSTPDKGGYVMRNGTKRKPVVPPSPESFWQLGYDRFRELAFGFRHVGGVAWHVSGYGALLCDQVAAELVNKLETVPVAQFHLAVQETISGMLMCALESDEFVKGDDDDQ
jgi:hypothetical protein